MNTIAGAGEGLLIGLGILLLLKLVFILFWVSVEMPRRRQIREMRRSQTMSKPTTITELLNASADLIERVGLHKGNLWPSAPDRYQDGSPVCLYGAMYVSLGEYNAVKEFTGLLLSADVHMCSELNRWPFIWSDENVHRPDYVVTELRRMAITAE